MMIAESILKLILLIIPLIVKFSGDKDDAIRRIRKIIEEHEQKNESSNQLESAESQLRELKSEVSDTKGL